MPRQIDREERRLAILTVTKELISERGLGGLSFREIGRRMGGSTTLVTHYYSTQADLLRDLALVAVDTWKDELEALEERVSDPAARLNEVLFEWLLPLEGEELINERYRINFVAAGLQGENTQEVLDAWEEGVKVVFQRILKSLVRPSEVDYAADVLRAAFNGIVLSTVEHPDHWTAERQYKVLQTLIAGLGLPIVPPPQQRFAASD